MIVRTVWWLYFCLVHQKLKKKVTPPSWNHSRNWSNARVYDDVWVQLLVAHRSWTLLYVWICLWLNTPHPQKLAFIVNLTIWFCTVHEIVHANGNWGRPWYSCLSGEEPENNLWQRTLRAFLYVYVWGRQHLQSDTQKLKDTTSSTGDQMLQTNGIKCTW